MEFDGNCSGFVSEKMEGSNGQTQPSERSGWGSKSHLLGTVLEGLKGGRKQKYHPRTSVVGGIAAVIARPAVLLKCASCRSGGSLEDCESNST